MLFEPPLLLALVAKELWQREPAHRLPKRIRARGDHARQRRRHLRPKCDLSTTLVREVVELADDLIAALLRVQLERLERGTIILDKAEPARDLPPHAKHVRAFGKVGGIEIAKSG